MDGTPVDTLEAAESVAAAVLSGVRALRDAQFWKLQHPELLAVGRLLESVGRSVYAAQVRWAGEVDDTDLASQLSVSSTRVLLRDTLRITAGDAAGRVRAARCTLEHDPISGGHLPARLPALGAALDDGTVGEGHVAVITQAIQALPRTLDAELVESAERLLVDTARDTDPAQVALAARHLATGRTARRVRPSGKAWIRTGPSRTTGNRSAGWNCGSGGGTRGPVSPRSPAPWTTRPSRRSGRSPTRSPPPPPRPTESRTPARPRCGWRRRTPRCCAAAWTPVTGPSGGGQVPHITMTIAYDPLTRAIADAALDFAGPLPAGAARRIACDAAILPMVLGGHSQVLDVGRAQRLFTSAQRRALTERDRGCAWPGCDRPPAWTQAHHILSWLDGGPTDLDNGVLLCLFHHQQAHRSEWTITLGADRRPDFIPPTWIDPRQHPRRNPTHRPLRT